MNQPSPIKNNYPYIWDLVIKDMSDRDQIGNKRYGVRLQPFNGRDFLLDLSEELLDGIVYLRGYREELKFKNQQLDILINFLKTKSSLDEKEINQILNSLTLMKEMTSENRLS